MIDLAELDDIFLINPKLKSGLMWKERSAESFKNHSSYLRFKKLCENEMAGWMLNKKRKSKHGGRYWQVSVNGKCMYCHRIVWMLYNESDIPDGFMVDHIDNNGLNNLPNNLRLSSNSENAHNRPMNTVNTSGYKGVNKTKFGSYIARIGINNQRICLGSFDSAEKAHNIYAKASKSLVKQFSYEK